MSICKALRSRDTDDPVALSLSSCSLEALDIGSRAGETQSRNPHREHHGAPASKDRNVDIVRLCVANIESAVCMGKRSVVITGCSSGMSAQHTLFKISVLNTSSPQRMNVEWHGHSTCRHWQGPVLRSAQQGQPQGGEAIPCICHSPKARNARHVFQ